MEVSKGANFLMRNNVYNAPFHWSNVPYRLSYRSNDMQKYICQFMVSVVYMPVDGGRVL